MVTVPTPPTAQQQLGAYSGDSNTLSGSGTNITAPQPQDLWMQSQSFINPYTNTEQAQIQNMPTNQRASQVTAPSQIGTAPLAALTNLGSAQSAPILNAQLQQINALNRQAQGVGPSVAEQQAKIQADNAINNQMAVAASQRGSSNPTLALRAAQIQAQQTRQQAIQAGILGKTQEQLSAQQQLTGALGNTQGQQLQQAQAQAGLYQGVNLANQGVQNQTDLANLQAAQQTSLANLQAQQSTMGMNTNEYNAMIQAQMALGNTNLTAAENYANLVEQQNLAIRGIQAGLQMNMANNQMGLTGAEIAGGAAIGGQLIAASDARLKTKIQSGARDMKNFLSQLSSPSKGEMTLLTQALV